MTFAAGVYLATAKDTTNDLRALDRRLTAVETKMDERQQRHDEQISEIRESIRALQRR